MQFITLNAATFHQNLEMLKNSYWTTVAETVRIKLSAETCSLSCSYLEAAAQWSPAKDSDATGRVLNYK